MNAKCLPYKWHSHKFYYQNCHLSLVISGVYRRNGLWNYQKWKLTEPWPGFFDKILGNDDAINIINLSILCYGFAQMVFLY